jgi:hypothetical protein
MEVDYGVAGQDLEVVVEVVDPKARVFLIAMRGGDSDEEMAEGAVDASKQRDQKTLELPESLANFGLEGALIPVDQSIKVGAMAAQFEPTTPPSLIPVRDQNRKKTDREENTWDNTKDGTLAGSLEGRRQAQ